MRRRVFSSVGLVAVVGIVTVVTHGAEPTAWPKTISVSTVGARFLDGSDKKPNRASESPSDAVPESSPRRNPLKNKRSQPKPAPAPWKGVYYDNDFSYKKAQHKPLFGESLKEMSLGRCSPHRLSTGGELRYRYMNDQNRFRATYPGRNDYQLWRWRHYVDYRYDGLFRVYFEGIDASSSGEEFPHLAIDVNRSDYINAFVDVTVGEIWGQKVYFRYGRQELLFGVERLISPLDWANTRRTFKGFKLFSRGDEWDIDLFATRPVIVFDHESDHPDASRTFSGVYASYKGWKDEVLDLYWLWDREREPIANRPSGSRQTVGARWAASMPMKNCCGEVCRVWLAEIEGAYQFGHDKGLSVQAGFFTAGLGHTWKALPWEPSVWATFDWASGDRNPADGKNNTFNQLYPLGHKYLGWFDGVGRQNIIDYNLRCSVKPCKKITATVWMHWFELDNPGDALYTAGGAPFAMNPAGVSLVDVGEELDVTVKVTFNPNADVLIGYSWFFNGDMLKSAGRTSDGRFFYVQQTMRY